MRKLAMVVAVVSVASLAFGVAGAQASTPAKTTKPVKVKLFEFKIKPKPKRVAAGKVTFVVKNIGSEQHEIFRRVFSFLVLQKLDFL